MNDLNPIVDRAFRCNFVEDRDGEKHSLGSSVSRMECDLIERSIGDVRATQTLEIGMAIGISTISILQALQGVSKQTGGVFSHTAIDPFQKSDWKSVGLKLIEEAGFTQGFSLIEKKSQVALPELCEQGFQAEFILIDGWHTFDHTLIDFFFSDQLLRVGGIIMIDDVGYPSVNSALRFILANRRYELVDVSNERLPSPSGTVRSLVKQMISRVSRTDRTPSPSNERLFKRLAGQSAVALRKLGHDTRAYSHYHPF